MKNTFITFGAVGISMIAATTIEYSVIKNKKEKKINFDKKPLSIENKK